MFIRQCAAAGYITRNVNPATFGTVQGSYASLKVMDKGRTSTTGDSQVFLPVLNVLVLKECASSSHCSSPTGKQGRKRIGKGRHMLLILKKLIEDKENWQDLSKSHKECYQYPGLHDSPLEISFIMLVTFQNFPISVILNLV